MKAQSRCDIAFRGILIIFLLSASAGVPDAATEDI